ncbi:hypothetical protein SEA_MRMIYAGI_35 [Mycobacterium phage MrMiyagi]|uniref:Uncharacterized protein n=1 Tax=Mycobacterium phage MrMiyagi TaxID=2762395 RepID=A0A7G8LPS7_9CAUD|nr:hypothetical protein SEA_MRMIYAGI_35 [Mycobacterium phage MrMiyagi]
MQSRESKRQLTEQLSMFGLKPTKAMKKQSPSGVVIDLLEISNPSKEFIEYGKEQ